MGFEGVPAIVAIVLFGGFPWRDGGETESLEARLVPPEGFSRLSVDANGFGAWLRRLPVKPGVPEVRLFDGRRKANQGAQAMVIDIDVGGRDLQQCADAVMRLFAEWQWGNGRKGEICFRFTSGDTLRWPAWESGVRPVVDRSHVRFVKAARPDGSYSSFRAYLDEVFTYAGTYSLARDLTAVGDSSKVAPGDVFIQGGFPGHAVVVVDVVENEKGERMFSIAQSYMPAQEIHVLKNLETGGAWYPARAVGKLETPEWTFRWGDLKRFRASACPK